MLNSSNSEKINQCFTADTAAYRLNLTTVTMIESTTAIAIHFNHISC